MLMPPDTERMGPVGVLGAGVMGTGVAHDVARHGLKVVLVDTDAEQLVRCQGLIRQNLRLYALHPLHGRMGEPSEDVLARIEFTTDLTRVRGVRTLIENVTEDWEIKSELYRKLGALLDAEAVIAVNTSAIPISRLAAQVPNPGRMLGSHFMNPVPLKPTVEIVRGARTTDETIARFRLLLKRLGKRDVIVMDSPGFVTNRAMMLFVNEAVQLWQEGVADPEAIDQLFRECFGHPMGPLQTADLIGLDTVVRSLHVLWTELKDPKFMPCPRLVDLVEAGRLGVKSGGGFYEYPTTEGRRC